MANPDDKAKREQLRQRLEFKRSVEKKSLDSVEALLEKNITEELLLQHCRNLWQQSYQDCTEERALSQLCGYPLCDNTVAPQNQKMPKYKICMRSKKVYSTEKQRIFCQLKCHQRSEWLKSQLSEEPLWLLGESYKVDINLLCDEPPNTPIPSNIDTDLLPHPCQVTVKEIEELAQGVDHVSIEENSISSRPKPYSRNSSKDRLPPSKESSGGLSVVKLEKLLCDWFTLGTLEHIVGHERYRQLEEENRKTSLATGPNKFDELIWSGFPRERLSDETASDEDNQGENDSNCVIQKSFPNDNAKPTSKRKNLGTKNTQRRVRSANADHTCAKTLPLTPHPPILPLVDIHHQRKVREKILLDCLSPVIETVSSMSNFSRRDLAKDVAHMVYTFRLKSDNCMLLPNEAVVVFAVIMMLIDRKAGGEGQIAQEIRTVLDRSLRNAGLSWGHICVALRKATEPRRLFEDARKDSDDYSLSQ